MTTLTWLAQLELDLGQWLLPFNERWLPATLCSMLVGVACGVLGCFVVLRRMALIGDALSHAILPGVVIAYMITRSTGVSELLGGALFAGLVTAVLINLVSRNSRTKEDSAIGIVFTALFALGIVLISSDAHRGHFDLSCFLFGDPLAVGPGDLWMMAIIAPTVVLTVCALFHPFKLSSFDPVVAAAMGLPVILLHYLLMGMLSATVVAGLKTTGVILVVAMIITPASAAYQLTDRFTWMLVLAGVFGAVSAAIGMSVAFIFNAPTGPAMVLVASAFFAAAMLLSPSHGIVFDRIRRWRLRRHIEAEDVLKAVYRLSGEGRAYGTPELAVQAGLAQGRTRSLLDKLRGQNLIHEVRGVTSLTERGIRRALEMVRAHRLWESYLSRHAHIDDDGLHDQAERLEHAHELADEVDQLLGYPQQDPHGSAIPPRNATGTDHKSR